MSFKPLTPTLSVSPQLTEADVARAAEAGFRAIIDNRPDGEESGQPTGVEMGAMAAQHGLAFEHIPVVAGALGDGDVARMAEALERLPGPVARLLPHRHPVGDALGADAGRKIGPRRDPAQDRRGRLRPRRA